MKRVRTVAGVIAFIIGLSVLVMVTSAYRKKHGKPTEKVMISKSQIFMIYLLKLYSKSVSRKKEKNVEKNTYNELWSLIALSLYFFYIKPLKLLLQGI